MFMSRNSAIFLLVSIFLLAQLVGLFFISQSVDEVGEFGETIIERPQTSGLESLIFITIGIAIGTLLLIFLANRNKKNWWKAWFFVANFLAVSLALGVFFADTWLFLLALLVVLIRFYTHNLWINNFTELLMYSGVAVFLVPILNVPIMIIGLVLISFYDMYAVWKSKHMVKIAQFALDSKYFPGITLGKKQNKSKKSDKKVPSVLGGGDIIFPLLFSGVVFSSLVSLGLSFPKSLGLSLFIPVFAALGLGALLIYGKKNAFYPAMPPIAVGSFCGYLVILLLL